MKSELSEVPGDTATLTSLPDFDPYLRELLSPSWDGDFQPILGPLFSNPELGLMQMEDGSVVAFRNRHLKQLASDPALTHVGFDHDALEPKGMRRLMDGHVAALSPPGHRPARKVFARPFAQGKAASYGDIASQAVNLTLAWAAENSPVDCQRDLGIGIARRFWALLIGLSEEEAALAAQLADEILPLLVSRYGSDPADDQRDPAWEYMEVISPAIQRQLDTGECQLLVEMASELEKIDVSGCPASVGELLGATLFDGFDTLSRSLSNILYCLTSLDSQPLETVRANPSLISDAYFECMRLHPPLYSTARATSESVSVDSIEIPMGTTVLTLWLFGNRDPDVFDDPETFVFGRSRQGQTTFGGGSYVCPGRGVTRVVGEALIREMVADTFALSVADEPKWTPFTMAHTLESMPIEVAPRA